MESTPLIVLQRAPYAGSLARAGLDLVLSFAAFSQRPRVLFAGAGVLQLLEAQETEALERKSLRKVIDSFPLYDIEEVFVDRESIARNGINAVRLPGFARPIDGDAIRELRRGARSILSL